MLPDGLDSKPQKQPWIYGNEEMFHWAVPLLMDIYLAQWQGRPLPPCSYMAKFLAELLGCALPDKGSSSVYQVGGCSDVVRPVFTVICFFLRCLWSVAFLYIFRLDINYWQLITRTFLLQKSSYAVEQAVPGGDEELWRCGTERPSQWAWWGWVCGWTLILQVSNLNDSMTMHWSKCQGCGRHSRS